MDELGPTLEFMNCPRCGVESHDQAKFCSECGLPLQATRLAPAADAAQIGPRVPVPDDVTMPGMPADVTQTGSLPAVDDVTMLGVAADVTRAGGLPTVDDVTMPGTPATDLTRPPRGAGSSRDAIRLASSRNAMRPRSLPSVTRRASSRGAARPASSRGAATPTASHEAGPLPSAEGSAERTAAEGPLSLGQQFGRYVIIRLLGLGGMGAVYQAWDEELEVAVAVKVIRPEVTADPEAAQDLERRFKRELLLARQVTHKNVVRIHDLGELEGIKYITMSYVHGTDLATTLQREGRLVVPRVLKILRGVVSGLVAAHEAGVVHRDLKPANIMVEEKSDEPLIMDFGIARSAAAPAGQPGPVPADGSAALSALTPSALADATMAGAVVGTLGYMAPEQAKAQEVDQRVDIYSLGLICYDLLLGPGRLDGSVRPVDELRQRLEKAPPPLRSVDPEIPEAVDRLVMRCLEPDPGARFRTTAELAAEIARLDENGVPLPVQRDLTKRLVGATALGAAVLMGATYWLTRPLPPKPAPPLTSVLVADFDDKTNNPVFKGSLEQALMTGLEGASFIAAYPRGDAQQLASEIRPGSHLDAQMARLVSAREGIKVVLAGTVERSGDGYSLKVDAVDPAAGKVVTTASASAPSPERILAAVGAVANDLRGALGDTAPERARAAAAETVTAGSLQALQAYARAQDLQAGRKDEEALAAYQQAIALDPNFGRAYAGMGVVYWNIGDDASAKAAYDKALKFVDRMTDREKLRTLGTYYMFIARNYEKALENYEVLVKLFPADDAGHANLSIAYLFTGNLKGAIEQVREVLKLNPRSTNDRYNYAMYSLYANDLETAVREGAKVAKESPAFTPGGLLPVALATLLRGDRNGALSTYGRLEEASPAGASLGRFGRADLLMYQGRYRDGLAILREAVAADGKAGNSGWLARDHAAVAEGYLALGQTARAVEAARKAASLTENESVLVPAALVLVAAGRPEEAEKIAVRLENMLQTHMTAYARLISAEVAVSRDRYAPAIELFRDSIKRRDTWLARLLLGRLYARTEHFPEAMAELDACLKRRGEAADVFFADRPTARYLPPALYWLARAQQALGMADARKLYEQFLAVRGGAAPPDPLAVDARKRLANWSQATGHRP